VAERQATFGVMWGLGPPAYLAAVYAIHTNAVPPARGLGRTLAFYQRSSTSMVIFMVPYSV
jgi:hypothetical protein